MRIPARSAAASLTLILLTSWAVRAAYFAQEVRSIPRVALASAPFLYEPGAIAYSLSTGNGFSSPFRVETGPTAWTTPVYPLLLAGIFEIFGTYTLPAYQAAALLNILFSTLTGVPIFYTGKRIAGTAIGAGAAWLWAVFPPAVIIPSQWIWDTSLAGLLAATILWATLFVAESNRERDWLAYGVLWGVALMTNATLLAGLPLLIGWMAYHARTQQSISWFRNAALAVGAIVLCCLPWTIRNYVVFGAFIPLRSALGLQLWLGNNDQYRDQFPGWLHPIDSVRERAEYIRMGEIAYMRAKERAAIDWMLSHPTRELGLFKDRFIATWLGTAHPVRDFARTNSLLVRAVFVSNCFAATGGFLGIVFMFQTPAYRAYAVPVATFPALYPFAFYLSEASLRYRYPIDAIVLLALAVTAERVLHAGWPVRSWHICNSGADPPPSSNPGA